MTDRTVILDGPSDQLINASDDFTLPCEVETDPEETKNLRVTWYLRDEPIDYSKQEHMSYNRDDFSLSVTGTTNVKDTL